MKEERIPAARNQQDKASQALEALQAALGDRLLAVVLFGSRARGESSAGSDWDLLVIASALPDKPFPRHLFLKSLLPPGCRGAVSLLARTPEEFEAHLASIHLEIALDGQVLYDPMGYAADRLGHLLELINDAGLYRERVEAGTVWRWSNGPGHWPLAWGS